MKITPEDDPIPWVRLKSGTPFESSSSYSGNTPTSTLGELCGLMLAFFGF
jgi:hypothetical protein